VKLMDRNDAGRRLAAELRALSLEDPMVLALPRGGVPVGYEIARELSAPLDVWVVGKIGAPWNEEFGIGAVAEGGFVHLSAVTLRYAGLSKADLSEAIDKQRHAVARRSRELRGDRGRPGLRDRTVIVADDGIATGSTMRAALESIRVEHPKTIILAVPVAAAQALRGLEALVDDIVTLLTPRELTAVGSWYEDFEHLHDDRLVEMLVQ
jgi:putative phosphoribosyl transferase